MFFTIHLLYACAVYATCVGLYPPRNSVKFFFIRLSRQPVVYSRPNSTYFIYIKLMRAGMSYRPCVCVMAHPVKIDIMVVELTLRCSDTREIQRVDGLRHLMYVRYTCKNIREFLGLGIVSWPLARFWISTSRHVDHGSNNGRLSLPILFTFFLEASAIHLLVFGLKAYDQWTNCISA